MNTLLLQKPTNRFLVVTVVCLRKKKKKNISHLFAFDTYLLIATFLAISKYTNCRPTKSTITIPNFEN